MVQSSQPDNDSSTPIPWRAEHEESSGNDKLWGDTDCVGIIYQQGLPDSANADFIVRAVNNHAKLLKALGTIRPKLGLHTCGSNPPAATFGGAPECYLCLTDAVIEEAQS